MRSTLVYEEKRKENRREDNTGLQCIYDINQILLKANEQLVVKLTTLLCLHERTISFCTVQKKLLHTITISKIISFLKYCCIHLYS